MKLAFQDYKIIGDNAWVGLKHFKVIFSSQAFFQSVKNTLIISSMKIFLFFPIPIMLALMINEVEATIFKKYIQSIIYLPHFLSWVVIAGIFTKVLSPSTGILNGLIGYFGAEPIKFMTDNEWIRWVILSSETWRSAGWDSIIYLAAIMKINPSLYEAASIDGASKFQMIKNITIPELKNTMLTVFILNLGQFMNAGFDQVLNFTNSSVINTVDILDTYIYRIGILNGQYAYATAAGLFKGAIGLALILITHHLSKRISGNGLW